VTERAIDVAREADHDRLIVHYMQPHHPFITTDLGEEIGADPFGREGHTTEVDALRRGLISQEEFWSAYRANLEYVLEDVELLLSNLDAERVVVSSDHGDAVGEWGIYDHPAGFLHPSVTDVPWSVTTAKDRGTFEPTLEPSDEADSDVEERLKRLGYL
jgi:arylsulfatase A-like enzyme